MRIGGILLSYRLSYVDFAPYKSGGCTWSFGHNRKQVGALGRSIASKLTIDSVSVVLTSRLIMNLRHTAHRTLETVPSNWSQSMEFGRTILGRAELSGGAGETSHQLATPVVRDHRELEFSPSTP